MEKTELQKAELVNRYERMQKVDNEKVRTFDLGKINSWKIIQKRSVMPDKTQIW